MYIYMCVTYNYIYMCIYIYDIIYIAYIYISNNIYIYMCACNIFIFRLELKTCLAESGLQRVERKIDGPEVVSLGI